MAGPAAYDTRTPPVGGRWVRQGSGTHITANWLQSWRRRSAATLGSSVASPSNRCGA